MTPTANEIWTNMWDELIHNRGEGLGDCLREGSKGGLPMTINSTQIPEIYFHYVLNSIL
jgi:hypothetical protein